MKSIKVSRFIGLTIILGLVIGIGFLVKNRSEHTAISSNDNLISSYEELVSQSQLIVLGNLTASDITFNMARDPLDIGKPHPDMTIVGRIYFLDVKEILKNETANPGIRENEQICIVNREGVLGSRSVKTAEEIAQARNQKGVILLEPNGTYLLFLDEYADLWKFTEVSHSLSQNCFGGIGDPWAFDASDPQNISVISSSDQANKFFHAFNLEDLKWSIAHPGEMLLSPYPAPGGDPVNIDVPYP